MLLSDPPQTFSQSKAIIVVASVDLSQVSDVSDHGLIARLLFVEGLGHVTKPLVQLWHTDSPHHQPADTLHSLCFCGEKRNITLTQMFIIVSYALEMYRFE